MGVSVQGDLCPEGSLSGGSLSGGSLSGGSLSRGLCLGGICPGGSLSGRPSHTVTRVRYASYWNAFLFPT